jgi:hypothetical protein
VSPKDASSTAPPPKDEARSHGRTRASVCPARRDATGSWTRNYGHETDELITPVRRDHLLDLEWTVVDAALASAGSPDPSPLARPPAPQHAAVTRPAQEPTQPRGPSEEDRGTSTVPASDFAPARAPAPDRTDTEVEDHWTEDNPYGRGLQAPRLPRPESLCWRCGVPGHSRRDCRAPTVLFCSRCGTMGLMSRECPCPVPRPLPSHEPPAPPAGAPRSPRQLRSERRTHCAAAAIANAATTAVEPGHHRRQEDTFSSIKFFEKPPFYLSSLKTVLIFQETFFNLRETAFFILFSRSRH